MVDLNRSEKEKKKGVPPLVWIILLIVVGWIAFTFLARGDGGGPDDNGDMLQPKSDTTYMPAAPARGEAPATEGRAITTPEDN
jgi:hypothetical protein